MAFPTTPLDVEVSIALSADLTDPGSWTWTNITTYVRVEQKIRIRRGRGSERSSTSPSRCTLTVDNSDGRFCRHNPVGAWYGQIGKNTPLRVRVNNGSGYVTRFVGYVSGWPPSWDPSGSNQTVSLSADGILRRLGQAPALRSPLYRAIIAEAPAAYWTFEDGSGATQATSALAGGTTLLPAGDMSFGSSLVPGGSSGAVDISGGGGLGGPTGISAGLSTGWEVECVVGWETLPTPLATGFGPTFVGLGTPGSEVVEWALQLREGFSSDFYLAFYANRPAGGSGGLSDLGLDPIEAGRTYHFRATFTQSGTDVVVRIYRDGVEAPGSPLPVPSTTLRKPTQMRSAPVASIGTKPHSLSHLAIWTTARGTAATYAAADGYAGEQAHERFERLLDEEGIPSTVTATTSQAMGAQSADKLTNLLGECATVDWGIIREPVGAAGLGFVSSSERYNQAAAITLDYTAKQVAAPWEPTDDDKDFFNDVTATRPDGSTARAASDESIAAVGAYQLPISANTETDTQLSDVAGWGLNLGLVDELRWPAVKLNLHRSTSLIDSWLTTDIGSQLHVTGHPSPLAPDTIRQVIDGFEEVLSEYEYAVTANLSPASGWDVAELDDDSGKLDTDGSDLYAAVSSSATSLSVATQTGTSPLWTTDAGEMPIPLIVGGEVMSATAVAAPTTITYGAVGTAAHGSNASVVPSLPASVAAGNLLILIAAIRNSGTGTVNTPTGYTRLDVFATTDNVQVFAKVAGSSESAPTVSFAGGVANATTSAQIIRIAGAFSDPAECFVRGQALLNSSAQDIAYPGLPLEEPTSPTAIHNAIVVWVGWKQDDWTSVTSPGTEIAEASTTTGDDQGLVWAYQIQTTATDPVDGSFVVTGGAAAISRGAVFAIRSNIQTFTVTRAVNGVSKAQTAGTAVNVYRPWRFAL